MVQAVKIADQMYPIAQKIVEEAGVPVSIQEVATHPRATKLGAQVWHATTALNALVKKGTLHRFRQGVRWMYEVPLKQGEQVIKPVNVPNIPAPIPAGLQIQVNKTTKRLSLMYEGLQIEISVVG